MEIHLILIELMTENVVWERLNANHIKSEGVKHDIWCMKCLVCRYAGERGGIVGDLCLTILADTSGVVHGCASWDDALFDGLESSIWVTGLVQSVINCRWDWCRMSRDGSWRCWVSLSGLNFIDDKEKGICHFIVQHHVHWSGVQLDWEQRGYR